MFLFREVCMKTRILTIAPYQGLKEMINAYLDRSNLVESMIKVSIC